MPKPPESPTKLLDYKFQNKPPFWYNQGMNYLMYYIEGFIKKFPLDKQAITIGRGPGNDLAMREDFISRNHVKITNHGDYIIAKDLGSTNGISFHDEKVKEALIRIGESFILGKMEFFLKRGSLDEFKLAKELIPIFDTISSENEKKFDNVITRYIEDIYNETLKVVMQIGLKKKDFKDFILDLPNHLSNLTDFGSLFIISKQKQEREQKETFDIILSVKNETFKTEVLKNLVKENPEIFTSGIIARPIPGRDTNSRLYAYPLKSNATDTETALIFILNRFLKKDKEEVRLEKFLSSLVIEIDLLSQLLTGKGDKDKGMTGEPTTEIPFSDDIVAEDSQMKELIKQAKKIADSDIFVLIQGESGTGKELFARLIHNHSRRSKNKFVALNCAAIPEDLLESELFGHEKGAFTGAYMQKNGKLEIASAGTLVLDEIGDMPINLQAKLLRALQEKEFYRLGGTTPITVDLRIISITNRDLKQLINEGKFREDLYYRLVHRTITIPPLRERKEDISALINFFTLKFCQQADKKISGYSVKAFEALQEYHWQGNVRQLENEIRSIVNLTDDGETVRYDILSEEIKENPGAEDITKKKTREIEVLPRMIKPEEEKAFVIKVLEKNNWNKTHAARELNMTYRGLHKKMQRMGIGKDSRQ
jgi:transcriptional regulator with GAF, ATPase, and Fis domain